MQRRIESRHLRRIAAAAVATGVVAALMGPAAALARPARGQAALADCNEHTAFFPIPADQARLYLPGGFQPLAAPADQESTTNFYVRSTVCGDPAAPQVEMITTYISVKPPQRYAAKDSSHRYVVHMGAEGPGVAALTRGLCLGDELGDAAIDVTHQRAESPLGFGPVAGTARSSVTSDFISTEFVVSAEGSTTLMREDVRWFYGDGKRFFDAHYELSVWGIGSSTVAFTKPYLELPPAAAGASVQSLADVTMTGSHACR